MNEQWCNEYLHLSTEAKALQKDCLKMKDKLPQPLIPLLFGQKKKKCPNNIVKQSSKSLPYCQRGRFYDMNDVKIKLQHQLSTLDQHCVNLNDALKVVVLNAAGTCSEERKQKHENNRLLLERAKCVCEKSINAYERGYGQLRDLCNDKIEELESKAIEIWHSLHSNSDSHGFDNLYQEE